MNLNVYEDHLSYITKLESYANKFQCFDCETLFATVGNLRRHEKRCKNKDNRKFKGGFYQPIKTIFDKLEELNIKISPDIKFYPWFAVYDMEAMLAKPENNQSGRAVTFVHKPVSVCICSNVGGFEKELFVANENIDVLLNEMVTNLTRIAEGCYVLAKERWKVVFESLNELEKIIEMHWRCVRTKLMIV